MENDWKYEMYSKLSKEELVKLLIEKDEQLSGKVVQFQPYVPPMQDTFQPPFYPTVTTPLKTNDPIWIVDFKCTPTYTVGKT